MSVSLFTFYTRERTFTRWFSFSIFRCSISFSSLWLTLWESLRYVCYLAIRIVLQIWWRPVYKISKEYCTDEAYSGTDLPWACSCVTHAAFGVFRHTIGRYSFYLPFTKNRVAFPDKSWARWLTRHDLPVKTRPAKSYSHKQIEIYFAKLFDALVLLRLHIILLLLYF